jgi:hypothetical protein
MWATGNLPRGTQVGTLWRQLLGREAETEVAAERPALSPEDSVAYMQAWMRGGR